MAFSPPNDRKPLTRKDLRDEVMRRLNISRHGASVAINELLNQMTLRLGAGESLAFRRFGIFRSHIRPARIGQGILANRPLASKRVLRFSPSTNVRQALRKRARRYYSKKGSDPRRSSRSQKR